MSSEGTDHSLDNSDVWDEESSEILQLVRVREKRCENFNAEGYRRGVFAGKDAGFKEGLNIGFKDSVLAGYKFGIVRGVSSALALLPDELREKLSEEEETRDNFQKLHNSVHALSTESAMKLFYGTMTTKQGEEEVGEEGPISALGSYVSELSSLLDKSPKIQVSQHLCGSVESLLAIVAARIFWKVKHADAYTLNMDSTVKRLRARRRTITTISKIG